MLSWSIVKMHSDHSHALSIFHVDRCMTWCQVKKMNSSSFNISAWLMSHYFFKHCSHDSQTHHLKWLFYLISFHQLLNNTVNVMKMFQHIDAVNKLQILQSLIVTIRRLFIWVVFFTSNIFSSFTDIDMSLIFFVDQLWLLERNVIMWVKTLHDNFSDHATF